MMTRDEKMEMIALVQEAFKPWQDKTDQRLDGIDQQLDGMDQRLDGMDQRFDGMDKRFDGIEGRLSSIELTLENDIRPSIRQMSESIDGLYRKFDEEFEPLRETVESHGHRIAAVEFALRKKQ